MAPQNDKFRLLRRIPDLRFEEVSKGYSKEQVNRVLDNLAQLYEEVERLQARLAEAETRAASAEARLVEARSPSNAPVDVVPPLPNADFDETLRNTMVTAQRAADTMVKQAQDEASRLQSEAELQSTAVLDDARKQASDMTAEAVAHRDKKMTEAEEERLELSKQYKGQLEERKSAIEAELEEAHETERANLLAQITDLKQTHSSLEEDIALFEEHLSSRRESIRAAITDLNTMVEDPTSLRRVEPPEAAETEPIDEDNYPKIGIDSPTLDELDAELVDADAVVEEAASDEDVLADDVDAEERVEVIAEEQGLATETEDQAPVSDDDAESRGAPPAPPAPPANGESAQAFENDVTVDSPEVAQNVGGSESAADDADDGALNSGDPFLAELRRVTNEDPTEGDPITDFLEDESSNATGGGWFGRRK